MLLDPGWGGKICCRTNFPNNEMGTYEGRGDTNIGLPLTSLYFSKKICERIVEVEMNTNEDVTTKYGEKEMMRIYERA